MGLFGKIFGKSNKIKVKFIDNLTGETISILKMTAEQLPESFSTPTMLHVQDEDWAVDEAVPEDSKDFVKSKNLVLKIRKVYRMNPNEIWFTMPTISSEFPPLSPKLKDTEFDLHIHEDVYRQKEFLRPEALAKIEIEFKGIKDIWANFSKKSDEYSLFRKTHVRKTIGKPSLEIHFNGLKSLLECTNEGQVIINNQRLQNGFSLETANTTYFGTLDHDHVRELCIAISNDKSILEILEINKVFNLVFVNWYYCDLIKSD